MISREDKMILRGLSQPKWLLFYEMRGWEKDAYYLLDSKGLFLH